MQISDLISIGIIETRKSKDGLLKFRPALNYKREYLALKDIFLVFKDNRVRLVTLDRVSDLNDTYLSFQEEEVMEELLENDQVKVMVASSDLPEAVKTGQEYDPVGKKAIFEGREFGEVTEIIFSKAHGILIIELDDSREIMIPDVTEFIEEKSDKGIIFRNISDFFELQ